MKKYYLSLICAGIVVGSAAAAAGLSMMSSNDKDAGGKNNSPSAVAGQNTDAPAVSENIPAPETEQTAAQLINPSTRIVFESYYQADKQTKVNDGSPQYFLLGMTREKMAEYYPDWDIVEFSENKVKLRRTIPIDNADHYVLGVKDSYLAVYQKADNGSVSLKEITATPIGALPPDDQKKLIAGIYVKNDDQLAKMLEDYGS